MTDQGFGLKEHKHNLIINTIHEGFWGFGIAFHSTYAVVPLFLKLLDAPPIIIGSAAGVFTACAALPQITMAFIGQRIQNVKKGIVNAVNPEGVATVSADSYKAVIAFSNFSVVGLN